MPRLKVCCRYCISSNDAPCGSWCLQVHQARVTLARTMASRHGLLSLSVDCFAACGSACSLGTTLLRPASCMVRGIVPRSQAIVVERRPVQGCVEQGGSATFTSSPRSSMTRNTSIFSRYCFNAKRPSCGDYGTRESALKTRARGC